MQDFRYAVRAALRAPGFTALAVALIGLAVALNAALFSLLYTSLLKPLPYRDADRFVTLIELEQGRDMPVLTPASFDAVRREVASFDGVTGYRYSELELGAVETPRRITAVHVLRGFFPFLGVSPALGRGLDEEDYAAAAASEDGLWSVGDAVVLDHEFWMGQLGGADGVVGSTVRLNDKNVVVVGVMPEGFDALWRDADVYVPWILPPGFWSVREGHVVPMAARLAPGATIERAAAEVATVYARLARDYPDTNEGVTAKLAPLRSFLFGNVSDAVVILQAGALLVLVVACANLAGLLSTRARKRSTEVAVRRALGASWSRIARHLMIESALIVVLGGAAGLATAQAALRLVSLPVSLPSEPHLSFAVVGFSVLILAATALFLGLVPASLVSRTGIQSTLRGRLLASGTRWLSGAFIVVQVALALGLVSASGLLFKSLGALEGQELGFDRERLATLYVTLPDTRYPGPEEQRAFRRRALEELRGVSGVISADSTSHLPMTPIYLNLAVAREGYPLPRGSLRSAPVFVSDGLLRTLGIRLLRGRDFEASDSKDAPWVVVVNERMARDFWPGQDAVGKRLRLEYSWAPPGPLTVIGVAANVKQEGMVQDVRPSFYILHEQFPQEWLYFALRAAGAAETVLPAVRARLASLDPDLPITDVKTMEARLEGSLSEYRSRTFLASLYAGAAWILATLGLYGALSSLVGQRGREIVIRSALGATRAQITGWAMRHGAKPLIVGLALGLGFAWATGRFVSALLFEIEASDPAALSLTTAFVAATGLLATFIPAYRASRLRLFERLRDE